MSYRIAVVQFEITQSDPNTNLLKAEKFIRNVSTKADVIIFPEDFITGPILARQDLIDTKGYYRSTFQKFAQKYKIDIIPGTIIERDGTCTWNTAYYIDRRGKVKGKYRKVNLWIPERKYLTFGNTISVFNTSYGKAGLIICWDLIFPEIFRRMVNRGVRIIYCPSYWCRKGDGSGIKYDINAELKNVNSLCTTRAFENEIVLVYANAAGKLKVDGINDDLIGQSQITVPLKGPLIRLNHNKEAILIQTVDTKILADAERAYKIRQDLKRRVL